MSVGRVVSTAFAVVTVAGCAAVVVGMARADTTRPSSAAAERTATPAATSIPAQLPGAPRVRISAAHPSRTQHAAPPSTHPAVRAAAASTAAPAPAPAPTSAAAHAAVVTTATTTAAPAPTTHAAVVTTAAAAPSPSIHAAPTTAATPPSTHAAPRPAVQTTQSAARAAAPRTGVALPVHGYTGAATKVVTVRAAHTWSTTATLQAWTKAAGGGWVRYGSATTAHIGADGMSRYPSESRSATPIGSFTLTQAFGARANPGTRLPYFRTTGADWWISQSGPLYNTHQHCWSGCSFNQGSPNEHLRYETPYYNWAVVIDYNTRNSPTGVRQGKGSAFFLHVYPTGTGPTAGCVAINPTTLTSIMRWLTPAAHPRILIGTS